MFDKSDQKIIIGETALGNLVIIQPHSIIETPHFIYRISDDESINLKLMLAEVIQPGCNMKLRERYDLQNFLTLSVWQQMICTWNEHNHVQVPVMQHIPYYVNLRELRTVHYPGSQPPNDCQVYIVQNDEDPRPHFHYLLPDETELAISLYGAFYLLPSRRILNRKERLELYQYLSAPTSTDGNVPYDQLIELWNNQNCLPSTQRGALPIDDILCMPDYRKLR